jgi:hypothetical protein
MGAQGFRLVLSAVALPICDLPRWQTCLKATRFEFPTVSGNLQPLELPNGPFRGRALTAPSFNGRTADSGSAYRGSNPWGAANHAGRKA